MRARWVLLAVLGGCYNPKGKAECEVHCEIGGPCPDNMMCGADQLCVLPNSPQCSERMTDAAVPDISLAGDGPLCFGQHLFHFCLPSMPGPRTVANGFDTATCSDIIPQLNGTGPDVCLITGSTINITGNVRVTGPNPLVMIATDTITIASTAVLDVSSHVGNPGAGAEFSGCTPPVTLKGANSGVGAAGGTGGSFGGAGGKGAPDSVAGTAAAEPTFVRGGCTGGTGGFATNAGGVGGLGGGSVMLIAANSIQINGSINASGGAGGGGGDAGGQGGAGGGGGGSGGLIALEASTITFDAAARVWAVGGGAGGGESQNLMGEPGHESTGPSAQATGGRGGDTLFNMNLPGGNGGAGGNQTSGAGEPGMSSAVGAGNGGGGGGRGWIKAYSSNIVGANATTSDPLPSN